MSQNNNRRISNGYVTLHKVLALKTVQVIRDTCNYLGVPYPKTHEIDWEDKDVWESMLKNSAGIFQFEGKRFALVKPCERASGVTRCVANGET